MKRQDRVGYGRRPFKGSCGLFSYLRGGAKEYEDLGERSKSFQILYSTYGLKILYRIFTCEFIYYLVIGFSIKKKYIYSSRSRINSIILYIINNRSIEIHDINDWQL